MINAYADQWLATSGAWSNAANWRTGLPGPSDIAAFAAPIAVSVTLDTLAVIAALVETAAPGSALTVSGTLSLSAGGAWAGSLIGSGGSLALQGGVFSLAGTLSAAGGAVSIAPGATLELLGPASLTTSAGAVLTNSGEIATIGGAAISGSLVSAGTLLASFGAFDLTAGGATLGGTVAGAGALFIDGRLGASESATLVAGVTLAIAELAVLGAGATLSLAGNAADAETFALGTGATLALGGQTLGLSGTAQLDGTLGGAGSVALTGTAEVGGLAVLQGATLLDGGAILEDGSLALAAGSAFTIAAGGSDTLLGAVAVGAGGTLTNAGSLVRDGAGTSDIAAALASSGSIAIDRGTLRLDGPSVALGGGISGAGTLSLAGNGQASLEAGLDLAVAATALAGTGQTALGGDLSYGGALSIASTASLALAGHTLSLSGAAALGGTLDGPGRVQVQGSADVSALALVNGVTLADAGLITQDGPLTLGAATSDTAQLTIDAGATWAITGDATMFGLGTVALANAGTLEKTGADGVSRIGAPIVNTGAIAALSGTLDLAGALTNDGTVNVADSVLIVEASIGADAAAVGTLALAGSGTLIAPAAIAASQTIALSGTGNRLVIGAPGSVGAPITGFTAGDTIDLPGLAASGYAYAAGILTLTDTLNGVTTTVATLALPGLATPAALALLADGGGGTALVLNHPGPAFTTAQATITAATWQAGSGDWATPSNWQPAAVPGANASATLPGSGTGYSVSFGTTDTIDQLFAGAGTSLDMTGGALTVDAGGSFAGSLVQTAGLLDLVSGLAIAGPFTLGAGATAEVDSATLALTAGTLAGTVTGAGALSLGALSVSVGTVTLASGLALGIASLEIAGAAALVAPVGVSAPFRLDQGATLALGGQSLALSGPATLDGTLAGSGTLTIGAAATLDGLAASGATAALAGTVIAAGPVSLGATSLASGAVLDLIGTASLAAASLASAGTIEKTGVSGEATLVAPLAGAGAIEVQAGTLMLAGGGTIAGAVSGAGALLLGGATTLAAGLGLGVAALDLAGGTTALAASEGYGGTFVLATGATLLPAGQTLALAGAASLSGVIGGSGAVLVQATAELNGLSLAGAATLADAGTISQDGGLTLGTAATDAPTLSIGAGALYDVRADVPILAAAGGSVSNAGMLRKSGGAGLADLAAGLASSGTIAVQSGTLSLTGGNNSLAGTVSGAGVLALVGPEQTTLQPGLDLTVATLGVFGGMDLALAANAADAGTMAFDSSVTLDLAGHTLTVGTVAGLGGLLRGAGTLVLGGAGDAAGLTLAAGAVFSLTGSLAQDGGVTLGTGSDVAVATIAAGATWDLIGDAPLAAAGNTMLTNAGLFEKTAALGASTISAPVDNLATILAAAGSLHVTGPLANDGTLLALGGEISLGQSLVADGSQHGSAVIGGGGTLALAAGVASSQSLAFNGSGTLALAAPNAVLGTITGFGPGDAIDLTQLAFAPASESVGWSAGTLSVTSGGSVAVALRVAGSYSAGAFTLATDYAGGTDILATVPCFLAGTRLATPEGPVPVEALVVGMRLLTATGTARPIRWIGRRAIVCRQHPAPGKVLPVRIVAGAFGPGRPARDVRLSPDHAVLAEGVLIPVQHLVNGVTIHQERPRTALYYHVELPSHDVVLAEGLAVESYLDSGNRMQFEGGTTTALHADFAAPAPAVEGECAPRRCTGPELARVRADLHAEVMRRGWRVEPAPALVLVAGGRLLQPARVQGALYRFLLPRSGGPVRLLSARFTPSDIDPASSDHRRLGIALSGVVAGGRALDLGARAFAGGFFEVESDSNRIWRWTDGDGTLALPETSSGGVLDLRVVALPRRWQLARLTPSLAHGLLAS